jgi:hypothetical protein
MLTIYKLTYFRKFTKNIICNTFKSESVISFLAKDPDENKESGVFQAPDSQISKRSELTISQTASSG